MTPGRKFALEADYSRASPAYGDLRNSSPNFPGGTDEDHPNVGENRVCNWRCRHPAGSGRSCRSRVAHRAPRLGCHDRADCRFCLATGFIGTRLEYCHGRGRGELSRPPAARPEPGATAVRDRKAPGSKPGPPTNLSIQIRIGGRAHAPIPIATFPIECPSSR